MIVSYYYSLKIAIVGCVLCLFSILFLQKDYVISELVDMVPVETELEIGKLLFDSYQKSLNLDDNTKITEQLEKIVSDLSKPIGSSQYSYKIFLSRSKDVNAFALPGGYIVVNAGLIEELSTADELYGVIAHEIAHVNERHILKNIIHSVGTYALFSIILGNIDGALAVIVGKGEFLLDMEYSRQHEIDADHKAIQYLMNANISPDGLRSFFSKLQKHDVFEGFAIFNTHPTSKERSQKIEVLINKIDKKTDYNTDFDLENLKSMISETSQNTTFEYL